jgi:hypothetical protein
MPYKYKKVDDKYVVYKKDTGERVGATAGNEEALRKYLAALHINAKEGVNEVDEQQYQNKLQSIFKQNYKSFVGALGTFAKDPKFRAFVKDSDQNRSTVKLIAIPVTKLIPTQNEIDVDKSLSFPLTKAAAASYALKGGAVKVAAPIITFNGKYIIDGHHRWSQLYAVNKDAKIVAYDFTNPDIKNPLDALKATQIAIIGAGATKIPSNTVDGDNLLEMDEKKLKYYVMKTITQQVLYAFEESGKVEDQGDNSAFRKAVADYIWSNVEQMQQTSQPVSGAPGRGVMPQADDVPGGQKATVSALSRGIPAVAENKKNTMKKTKEQIIREYIRREIKKALKEEDKPDYLDADKDGNKEEPMKKAFKDKEK